MAFITTGAIIGANLAAVSLSGMSLGGTATMFGAVAAGAAIGGGVGYGAQKAVFGDKDYLGDLIPGSFKSPDMPEPTAPPPTIDIESEGIRKSAMKNISRTEQLQKLYATRGTRAEDATLGGYRQTLG